jgi:AcrR family transcriptional regulator
MPAEAFGAIAKRGTMKGNTRQRLSAEKRQDEIVKAAVNLAGEQGMDNVTTQNIADLIGVTQGAIFRHFPTKGTIWLAVVHWVRGRLMGVVDIAASQARDPLEAIERIFFAHIGFAERNPAVPRLLFSTNPQLKNLVQEMLAGYEEKLTALLVHAKAQRLVRPDLDESDAATLFIAIVQGLVMRVLILGPKKSLLSEATRVFPIYLAGLGASTADETSGTAKKYEP